MLFFHEAAITSVPASIKNPDLTEEVNVKGTEKLLKRSVSEEVERFIFASSCAIYGELEGLSIDENLELKPASPYTESKIAGEKKVSKYGNQEKIDTVILRYFNVYDPRQSGGRYTGVISNFLERLSKDEPPIIYGDGEQTSDFVYVQDIVRANLLALKAKKKSNQIFNIGSGKGIFINELCETLLNTLGNQISNQFTGRPEKEISVTAEQISIELPKISTTDLKFS